ncbi:hypothetical protein ACRZ5S_23095 (plasmid) [Vibrio scophthalmi]|uniref:hypothetical protein n=1 Tax=Vibrio scophthalmi TaxID=45658 RepID=UPI003EBE7DD5
MNMTTSEVAEHMFKTGRFYTAGMLKRELDISIEVATSRLFNIKAAKKYQTVCQGTPVEVKVVDIQGKAVKAELWQSVLQSSWG